MDSVVLDKFCLLLFTGVMLSIGSFFTIDLYNKTQHECLLNFNAFKNKI